MPEVPVILCFGHDPTLLGTRQFILEKASFVPLLATSQQDFVQHLSQNSIGLALLCHTLTPEERDESRHLAHQHSPSVPVLILTMGIPDCDLGIDDFVDSYDGPQALMLAITRVLGPRLTGIMSSAEAAAAPHLLMVPAANLCASTDHLPHARDRPQVKTDVRRHRRKPDRSPVSRCKRIAPVAQSGRDR